MNCFREIKCHVNILDVHCNNVTNSKSATLNSNELMFMGKTAKYKAFTACHDQSFSTKQNKFKLNCKDFTYSSKIWMCFSFTGQQIHGITELPLLIFIQACENKL